MLVDAQVSSMKTSRFPVELVLALAPSLAALQDVRTILLRGMGSLFYA
jgi:hypothetical protein